MPLAGHASRRRSPSPPKCEKNAGAIWLVKNMYTQNGMLYGNMDQNQRSDSWWFNLDPYPVGLLFLLKGTSKMGCVPLGFPIPPNTGTFKTRHAHFFQHVRSEVPSDFPTATRAQSPYQPSRAAACRSCENGNTDLIISGIRIGGHQISLGSCPPFGRVFDSFMFIATYLPRLQSLWTQAHANAPGMFLPLPISTWGTSTPDSKLL